MAFFSQINNKRKTDYHKTSGREEQLLEPQFNNVFPSSRNALTLFEIL